MSARFNSPGPNFLTLEGRGTAPGSACGPLRRNTPDLLPGDAAGSILVAEKAVPEDVGRILASAGTVTLGGAVLSHVSLLSREFAKPSVSLAGGSRVRLIPEGAGGLLDLADVVGGDERPVLDERDIVLIDGDLGLLYVPGGADRESRLRVRMVHAPLAIYGRNPDNRTHMDAVIDALGDDRDTILEFLLEAALLNRLVPSGPPARRLVDALLAGGSLREAVLPRIEALQSRVREQTVRFCARTGMEIAATTELDDLDRRLERLERYIRNKRDLLEDLGGPTEPLDREFAPVREAAAERRELLRNTVRNDAEQSLGLPDEVLRPRIGGLYQLLRRARSASLDEKIVTALQARLSRFVAEEKEMAGAHLVVPLGGRDYIRDRTLVGGKAAGLFRVLPILPEGCRVPNGFVVTSSAYRLHLLGETGEKLREASGSNRDEAAISRSARAAVLGAPIPDEVVAAVREAYQGQNLHRMAVRSSATIEDGPAGSLAGQFDTYLGVTGLEELLNRIRWAWASLWNTRALRTMAVSGHSPLGASQAVLVQEMTETRSAGVLFSRDPAGRPDALLVNAAWGLGEGISQGEVGGDLYWVKRSTGELIASETGRSRSMIVLDTDRPGTLEADIPPDRLDRPCLDTDDLGRLAALARALEEATGRSQDVEFGFSEDGTLLVFQVRRVVPRS